MPVDVPNAEIKPYQSTVPTIQLPPDVIGGETRPAQPLQGQFGGHKGSGALAIGDAILKGVMLGHEVKAQRKAEQAKASIAAADASTDAAYQKYQESLSKAGGDVKNPEAAAAYQAYLGVFNQSKQAKAQFVIPDEKAKGGKSPGGKEKSKIPGMGGIKEFFEANPHVIPQIALMTMQPKGEGLDQQGRLAQMQETELKQRIDSGKQNLEIGSQNIELNKQSMAHNAEAEQRAAAERKVEENGGIEAVLKSKDAAPDLRQAASRMKFEALDKQSPEGRLKMEFANDVLSGNSKHWTPEQRMLAGAFGVAPQPQLQTIVGKNGHQQQILVDPTTNQPIAGSKPLDLGPPQWASEFYAKRSADRKDLEKAVESDPAGWGVTLTGDAKADKAAIGAKAEQLFVKAQFGLQNLSEQFGKTGYEVQRDNEQLQTLMREVGLDGKSKTSWLDQSPPTLTYPDGKTTAVGSGYMGAILHQFITKPSENAGVMAYRDTPLNPDGKSPETLEAERKFAFQFVKNHLMTQKGKLAMTEAQATAFLQRTALGQPVKATSAGSPATGQTQTQTAGGITPPPQGPSAQGYAGTWPGAYGRISPPPQVGQQQQAQAGEPKLYMVPGVDGPVQLTAEEVAKAKQNNIPLEELSSDLMNQFLGK
jgi:hypothetical protein